ncbi:MAG: hypothetical protein AB7I48_15365, partial [Planctomycetaceae bacterium]
MSRATEEVPQEFLLSCECGQVHQGLRRSKPQRIICQTCGSALFVLPRNLYPVLKPQLRKRRRRKSSSTRRGELPSLGTFTRRIGRGTAAVAGVTGQAFSSAGLSVKRWIANRIAAFVRLMRSQLTPFRLVLAGIIAVLGGTAYWTVQTRYLDAARQTLREEFAAGESALAAEDAVAAQAHFQRAAAAADRLQSNDLRARQARQMLHETLALTRLAPVSLLDMLEEAERTAGGEHPEIWGDRFRAAYAGAWIVLDAPIHAPEDKANSSTVAIDLPLVVGNRERPVHVAALVPDAARLPLSSEPQQAIFAAAIIGCELDSSGQRWLVTLTSESGFLWSDLE